VAQGQTIQTGASTSTISANGIDDAFNNLSFGGPTSAQAVAPVQKAQAAPIIPPAQRAVAASPIVTSSTTIQTGGNFFNAKPKSTHVTSPTMTSTGFDALTSLPKVQQNSTTQATSNNGLDDLLGLSTISASPMAAVSMPPAVTSVHSPFNLSQKSPPMHTTINSAARTMQSADLANPWGASSADAWSAPALTPLASAVPVVPSATKAAPIIQQDSDWGWGSNVGISSKASAPHITADDDFGSWESSTMAAPTPAPAQTVTHGAPRNTKPGGLGGGEDLFSNVWE